MAATLAKPLVWGDWGCHSDQLKRVRKRQRAMAAAGKQRYSAKTDDRNSEGGVADFAGDVARRQRLPFVATPLTKSGFRS